MKLAQNFVSIQNSAGLPAWNVLLDPGGWIELVLPYIFYGAAIALLVFLVIGGIQLMASRGDPKGMQGAQARITNAFIGFVVVVFSGIIVSILGSVFGIEIFNEIFG